MADSDTQVVFMALLCSRFLPPTCCYHDSRKKPGPVFGGSTGAVGLSPLKRGSLPSVVPSSFFSEKSRDLFLVK